jgi:hypothetical protein
MDSCPIPLTDNSVNAANHLKAITENGLGPADPTQSNQAFWQDKATKWQTTEGDARCRLCMNCEHYLNTTEIYDCITSNESLNIKASDLPLTPKWKDIESRPVAYCTLLDITCSPVRTCDAQELGGPMDDIKVAAMQLAMAIQESGMDTGELEDVLVEKAVEVIKMYSASNPPRWASKKSDAVKKVAIEVFNTTFKDTGSEEKARIASLAAMKNAEAAFKKTNKSVEQSVEDIMKAKYS